MRQAAGAALCAAGAVVAVVAVAGCGAGATVDPVARAASISTRAAGYTMKMTMQISSGALPSGLTGTGSGVFDARDHAGSLKMDMRFPSIPQLTQVLGGDTMHIDEIMRGQTIYMKLPGGLTSKLPGGKPWLKIDLSKAFAGAGLSGLTSLTSNPASSDPGQFLQYLRGAGSVTNAGKEQVDGRTTTHYAATVQLDKVADVVPQANRQAVKQAITALERMTNLHSMPVDVWIDSTQLVRRMAMSFDENLSAGQQLAVRMVMDFLSYGPQRQPAAPAANQVTDLSALASRGLQSGQGG